MMLRPRFAFRIKVSSLPWRTFNHIFGELCVRDIGGRSLSGLPYNYMLFEKKPDHGCAWRIKGNWVGIPDKAVTVCGAVPRVRLLAYGLLVSRVFWEPLDSGEQKMTSYLLQASRIRCGGIAACCQVRAFRCVPFPFTWSASILIGVVIFQTKGERMLNNIRTGTRKFLVVLMAFIFASSSTGMTAFAEEVSTGVAAAADQVTAAGDAGQGRPDEDEPSADAETGMADGGSTQEQESSGVAVQSIASEEMVPAAQVEEAGSFAKVVHSGETVIVNDAADMPETIEAGATVKLGANISMGADQQIETVDGTLDGQGHTVTINGKAVANNVAGSIQNLGVTGSVSSTDNVGSIAMKLSGTIQMCWSTASVNLSGWMGCAGGLVGGMTSGKIVNSYFAGSGVEMNGGLVGEAQAGSLLNCLYTVGFSPAEMNNPSGFNKGNAAKAADLSSAESLDVLNTDAPSTGFSWVSNGGLPLLVSGSAPVVVNKDALVAAITAAEALNESDYTTDSWSAFAAALAEAKIVNDNDDASQSDVNAAVKTLKDASDALEKKKPTAPVAQPESVKHISSQDDFMYMNVKDASNYYVLDSDIVIDDEWFFGPTGELNCAFDGQGHTITFDNKGGVKSLFESVGSTGVIQNVSFAGELKQAMDGKSFGPLGNQVKGSVINCSTSVTGKGVAGFGRTLKGGVISNCMSTAASTGGVLFASYDSGQLINTYWQEGLTNKVVFPADALVNSYAVDTDDMKTATFVENLNVNRGENGSVWGMGSDGFPHFGENLDYESSESPAASNKYEVKFTSARTGKTVTAADGVLCPSPDDVVVGENGAACVSGTLELDGLPKDAKVTWGTPDANRGDIAVNEETGLLHVYNDAVGTVTATLHKDDGTTENVAAVVVKAVSKPIDDFQIWYNGANVTGGAIAVVGSEVKNLEIRVHYTDAAEGEYTPVSYARFRFAGTPANVLYSNPGSACFYFKKPGEATIWVSSRANFDIASKSVTVTSSYVPATSVSLGYNEDGETVYLHGRNPLAKGAFLTDKAAPVVGPENASDRACYTVTSSDAAVAEYTTSGEIGFTPYKAGKTTFEATVENQDGSVISSGKREVTYAYRNPLKSVTITNVPASVKAGKTVELNLSYTGENDAEGWSVSEPGMQWSVATEEGRDASDAVSIDRRALGDWKHVDGAPDDGLFVASGAYVLTANKAGTYTVTGTPIDQTAGAQAISFEITVDGIVASPDNEAKADEGTLSAAKYFDVNRTIDAYTYGQEWEIYAFATSGRKIDDALIANYKKSLTVHKAEWSGNTAKVTDCERVALALTALGEDITSFDGVNLIADICSHEDLVASANNVVYALIALDEAGISNEALSASGSSWTRAQLVYALLSFQNPDGGFTIDAGGASNVDMTAMALQALAPYVDDDACAVAPASNGQPSVASAVNNALGFLRGQMNGLCDFGSVESNAQVLLALVALGKDPVNTKNGFATGANSLITAISAYEVADGKGYAHTMGSDGKPGNANALATVQALRALSAYKSAGSGVSWSKIGGVKAGVVEPGGSKKPVTPEVPVPAVPTKNPTPAVMPTGSQRGDGSGDKQGGSGMQEVGASQDVDANKGESDKKSGSDEPSGSKTTSAAAASRKGALDGRGGVNPVAVTGVVVGIVCLAAIGAWFVRSRKNA